MWKVEYLSNDWWDLCQIWIVQKVKIKITSNGIDHDSLLSKVLTAPFEDSLKIWKVEYFSNHWSDLETLANMIKSEW
jgi:hypothetical protein